MLLERFVTGRTRTNAYLYAPEGAGPCVIVDPGVGAASRISARIRAAQLEPVAILCTHGHYDHVWSARELSDRYGIGVWMHAADWRWLDDPLTGGYVPLASLAGRVYGRAKRVRPVRLHQVEGNASHEWAAASFSALHTPGHTPGGISYLTGGICFVGDTAFAGGLGHTTYPGGERRALRLSIRTELLALPDDVRLYPGHGPDTTVGRERARWEAFTGSGGP